MGVTHIMGAIDPYAVNINQKIAGFDCTFYNYLDGFEQVCSYILPVI